MRKRDILFFSFVVIVANMGCGAKKESELPQLVIGCDDYRPYHYTDEEGEPAGIDVELAVEACRRMGYEAVFEPIDWNMRDDILQSGAVDCLWSCYSMNGEQDYEWVGPYLYSRQVVAVLETSPIHQLQDLNGGSVAVKVGSQAEKIFLRHLDRKISEMDQVYSMNDVDAIITALRNDYVDACAGYGATLTVLLKNAGVPYRFLDEELSHARLGIAFSKNSDPKLRKALESALNEMRQDGTIAQILEDYGLDVEKNLGEGRSL